MARNARTAVVEPLREFLHAEAAGGVVLVVAAAAALLWANLPAVADSYGQLWDTDRALRLGPIEIVKDLRHWVNDGLMALFFFVVGLEIKRELVTGELRDPRVAVLPALAAAGGVIVPAALFLAIAPGQPAADGWGIPVATDIAFVVGVLALLGARAPAGAKLFLLSVAIVDDLIAISIIAVFYSEAISLGWLAGAAAGLLTVAGLRAAGVRQIWVYAVIGVAVWFATLESGVHATIAGVALGLLTPARPYRGRDVLVELEHRLHPVSAYLVVPLFALANAGVALSGGAVREAFGARLTWAVVVGLVIGKTIGITLTTLAASRLRVATLPADLPTRAVWGLAALAGIGFTVSLFIADLAFDDPVLVDQAKVGILLGSALSAAVGVTLILLAGPSSARSENKASQ